MKRKIAAEFTSVLFPQPGSTLTCPASLRDSMRCYITGMDEAGLLHLATHMPQLLHLDVRNCHRITEAGRAMACAAAAGCSEHGMVITDNVVYWQ